MPGLVEPVAYHARWLLQIIDKVVEHHLHRIYIVDNQGRAVGVVTLTDILRQVTEEARAA